MANVNRNINQQQAPPSADLRVSVGSVRLVGNNFEIPLRIRAFLSGNALINSNVVIEHNFVQMGNVMIDATGSAYFLAHIPDTYQGNQVGLKIHLANRPEEVMVHVNLPRQGQNANIIDPDRILVTSWILGNNGFACFNIRVIGDRGKAITTRVSLIFEGTKYTVDTDADGHAYWELPRLIQANERLFIKATVDGVYKPTVLKLWNAPLVTTEVNFRDLISRRSFIITGIIAVVAVIFFFISLLNVFSGDAVELMTNKNPSDDLGWALTAGLCLLAIIPFVINIMWYYVWHSSRRIKETVDYRRTRSNEAHNGDPMLENIMDNVKGFTKKKDTISQSANISSASEVVVGKGMGENIFDEIIAEITAHGLGSAFKYVIKFLNKF